MHIQCVCDLLPVNAAVHVFSGKIFSQKNLDF